MSILAWNDKFDTGVGPLNDEHHEMFDALNALQDAVANGEESSQISKLLHQLRDRTSSHLTSEDEMMEKTAYPGRALHKMKHQRLTEQINAFVARFERGGFVLDKYSFNFLTDWLTAHIENDDVNFGRWLNKLAKS